ncbi:hypothetical protein EVAR_52103_1 [Eumeta japonica]|uniref:Uncharacterized protein n=1 Tax=Eumeta variegata TaxID=151549 RepID=A0A4C1XT12_EUMVA|nr:hypothetical protein EVAR_52103_1 [Eumeta japonica]
MVIPIHPQFATDFSRTPRPRRYTVIKRVTEKGGGHSKDIEVPQPKDVIKRRPSRRRKLPRTEGIGKGTFKKKKFRRYEIVSSIAWFTTCQWRVDCIHSLRATDMKP